MPGQEYCDASGFDSLVIYENDQRGLESWASTQNFDINPKETTTAKM
jgi:hypothetical protein